jgi:hypothetical protein
VAGEVSGALFGGILRAFNGVAKGAVASGDESLDQVGRDVEGGRALGGIKHAEPPRSAGAGVEETAAALETLDDRVDRAGDVGDLAGDGGRDLGVGGIDELHEFQGGELVKVRGGGVACLSEQGGE